MKLMNTKPFQCALLLLVLLYTSLHVKAFQLFSKDDSTRIRSVSAAKIKGTRFTKLKDYDDIILETAKSFRIDWRLIASIVAIESSFRPNVVSHSGAKGLMQLMPSVAREYKVTSKDILHPKTNLNVGTRHLLNWMSVIEGETGDDVLKLTLAAYNAGLGHLRDAQRLAIRKNKSPHKWEDIKQMYLLLEKGKFNRRANYVRYGRCQGTDVIKYVQKVTQQYTQFKSLYASNMNFSSNS